MIPIVYNLRSLAVRKTTTLATVLGIALVVFALSSVTMLAAGVRKALSHTGRADVALLLRKGSDSEVVSAIELQTVPLLLSGPEVARKPNGEPDGVAELVVILNVDRHDQQTVANVQVRGVGDDALHERPDLTIVAGRAARPGTDECLLGRALVDRFAGLRLGGQLELNEQRTLTVVGVMAARGAALESEVWADLHAVQAAFARTGYVSSVRVRLTAPGAFPAYQRALENDPRLGVSVQRETVYLEHQAEGSSGFITGLGGLLCFLLSLGAMLGALITMHAATSQRAREIGTLRALGFGRQSIVASFVLEAALLGALGGVVGTCASLALGWVHFSVVNAQSWNETVFSFEPTWQGALGSLIAAIAMGVLGGLLPALRAARLPLVHALRA